jgi:hypothetical protein
MADKSGKELKKAEAPGRNLPSLNKTYDTPEKANPYIEGMLFLQKTAGNHAVQRIMQSRLQNNKGPAELILRARSDPWSKIDDSVRNPIEQASGVDLGTVKVHSGPASSAAAESIGARAYTTGSNIYLGADASVGNEQEKRRTLAHEAVHTIQQGGSSAIHRTKLDVSNPSDTSEIEADRISESIIHGTTSRSLGLLDNFRKGSFSAISPLIQRDIKGDYDVRNGKFKMDLRTESHPSAKCGMSGTIKFNAGEAAPDSNSIRLLQVVRFEDLSTGKDYVWSGAHANRSNIQTVGDKARGVEAGFGVDVDPTKATRRTKVTDKPVSPYYRDYWPNKASSQDGSKKGKDIKEASLWDYPGWDHNMRFSFETVAKAADTDFVYGTVMWGFTISDASKGVVDHERAVGRNVTLLTTDEAIKKFNEFYRNPGASTAPK